MDWPSWLTEKRTHWRNAVRILPSRFPTINLFERVAPPGDFAALNWVESLTNARLRQQAGEIDLIPRAERVYGPGASVIMAPFTHRGGTGSRFANAMAGALYAARSLATAIAETRFHRERFLRLTGSPRLELDMRIYELDIRATRCIDVRGEKARLPEIYEPDGYERSQAFAAEARKRGAEAIAYDSVRHERGQCLAALTPRICSRVREGGHLAYVFDGERIAEVYRKAPLRPD
ncbi:MAG: RES family NAD+ phosphorylase [Steroidobacteraceae bacterium]